MTDLNTCRAEDILLRRRSLRRELAAKEGLRPVRIAVLSGSTTEQFCAVLELLLLDSGFQPAFHQGHYNRYYEEAVLDTSELQAFQPDVVYLHTSSRNIQHLPPVNCTEADLPTFLDAELSRWREIWDSLHASLGCQVIQNNFELPAMPVLGNMAATAPGGDVRFIQQLNLRLAEQAGKRPTLLVQDALSISAQVGLKNWFDADRFFSYKILHTPEAQLALARSLSSMVRAIYGRSRKVLVLDLDNTLWGGVIGDDGLNGIAIGKETPQAEAYTAFQQYCLALRNRGVLLAVCSKNNEDVAKSGFTHPDSVLKLEHISCFKANWEPKHENIEAIARELNLGVDSFVFVDDNPAERAIVRAQLPQVAVPEVGESVSHYPRIIDAGRYFEPATLVKEDFERAAQYAANAERTSQAAKFANYGEYLDSLEMQAEIAPIQPVYFERVAQLTNKSNQFNLTTRRYTQAEIEALARDPAHVVLYGRLTDRFGDNGLVSVVIAREEADTMQIELWLMSCRVLKREMENAMLDALVEQAQERGLKQLIGRYLPTPKNNMVAGMYAGLGFAAAPVEAGLPEGATVWTLEVDGYVPQTQHIQRLELVHA